MKMENFTEVSAPKEGLAVDKILKKSPSCEYDAATSRLKVPDEVEDEVGLDSNDWGSGCWTTYCCECNKLLLMSIWFFG